MTRLLFVSTIIMLFGLISAAQDRPMIDTALIPFWKTSVMHNESVLMVSDKGSLPSARLLFRPDRILSVRNAGLDTVYKEGVDWEFKNGELRLLQGSDCIYLTREQLNPTMAVKESFPRREGGNILFREGAFFHKHQLSVTYTHTRQKWSGPVPTFQKKGLREVLRKLKKKKPLRVVLFGDSIAAGANGSGDNDAAPNLPGWGNLFVERLKRNYSGEIVFTNTAAGGKDSQWGLKTAEERVLAYHPDLVIIAFGMNDGTRQMDPQTFKQHVHGIIQKVRTQNNKAACILVAPMLPNPESKFVGTQPAFKKVLQELTGEGIVMVDMTTVHEELLKYKSYQDMTGNNINHPNDFLIRWYALQLSGLLIPAEKL